MRLFLILILLTSPVWSADFSGRHYRGSGDVEYLQLLDISRRMFEPDAEFQNISMLYIPKWNGFVEGPTWDAWWIQNSYGTSYCALPFLIEPYTTFLQNSQDLWFSQMGDGHRKSAHDWIAPDGCLCDCAQPGRIYYRQGDGRVDIHDWAMEFTAAGVVLQSETLLISRDSAAIAHYLPMLKRCCAFIESRRDPKLNLFLAGPAGNLLAPSYAGWHKPDGSYGMAYLTGLSVTYIAALDRMIELEKLAGDPTAAATYIGQRDAAKLGLRKLETPQGYFVKSLDPDGTIHGRFGAAKHGYFEASPNHDAIAFRVVNDSRAEKIYQQIAAIPQLRPHDFILPNYPSYDDMYEKPVGLWGYGTWVNGGNWSTCEGRMILAYARLEHYEDIRRSMNQLMRFAHSFRMDNPLVDFGNNVYQPYTAYNLCYDNFAPPAAMIRGLFEYLYRADELVLVPHIPPTITRLEQRDPIRFGDKQIYLAISGNGPIHAVTINGQPWQNFTAKQVHLPFEQLPERAVICIGLSETAAPTLQDFAAEAKTPTPTTNPSVHRLERFIELCASQHVSDRNIIAHARLAAEAFRVSELHKGQPGPQIIPPLPPVSKSTADQLFVDSANQLLAGLQKLIDTAAKSDQPGQKHIALLWQQTADSR